jgi:hypothetical protein
MCKEIIIRVPAAIPPGRIISVINRAVVDAGLIVTLRGNLKSFPGCTHWHLKRGRLPGTLEIIWWPQHRRLWFKIQAGRTAKWIEEMAPGLKKKIESLLGRPRKNSRSVEQ